MVDVNLKGHTAGVHGDVDSVMGSNGPRTRGTRGTCAIAAATATVTATAAAGRVRVDNVAQEMVSIAAVVHGLRGRIVAARCRAERCLGTTRVPPITSTPQLQARTRTQTQQHHPLRIASKDANPSWSTHTACKSTTGKRVGTGTGLGTGAGTGTGTGTGHGATEAATSSAPPEGVRATSVIMSAAPEGFTQTELGATAHATLVL